MLEGEGKGQGCWGEGLGTASWNRAGRGKDTAQVVVCCQTIPLTILRREVLINNEIRCLFELIVDEWSNTVPKPRVKRREEKRMTVMYKSPVACTENNQYLYMGKEAMS